MEGGSLVVSNNAPTARSAASFINDGGGSGPVDDVDIFSYGSATIPAFGMWTARGTAAAPQNSQTGDDAGALRFNTMVNGSFAEINRIKSEYLGNGTTLKSRLTLNVNGPNNPVVSVDSSGFVGVGTASPETKLQVADTGDVDIRVTSTTATTGRMRVSLGNHLHGIVRNLTKSGGLANDVALFTNSGPGAALAGNLYLSARPSVNDTVLLDQFTLKNTGNVGIGTKDPATGYM